VGAAVPPALVAGGRWAPPRPAPGAEAQAKSQGRPPARAARVRGEISKKRIAVPRRGSGVVVRLGGGPRGGMAWSGAGGGDYGRRPGGEARRIIAVAAGPAARPGWRRRSVRRWGPAPRAGLVPGAR